MEGNDDVELGLKVDGGCRVGWGMEARSKGVGWWAWVRWVRGLRSPPSDPRHSLPLAPSRKFQPLGRVAISPG